MRLQVGQNPLAGLEAVQTLVGAGVLVHAGGVVHDFDFGQAVAAADLEVVGVVAGGNLDHAGAELAVHVLVGQDGNFPLHQRQQNFLADKFPVALVFRVDGDGGIAQQSLRTRGGNAETVLRAN